MNTKPSLLIVDDEKDILKSLKDTLAGENFTLFTAMTGKDAIATATKERPDLILLDLRLPDIDGYDVCRELKKSDETKHIPIIMLSTRSKDTEKVVGLEIGADDYLTKPYNTMELLARIRVALRRIQNIQAVPKAAGVLRSGDLLIDPESRSVKVNKKEVKLTRKEFDLLVALISKPGKVFNRSGLMEMVWGYAYDSLQGTVDSHIKTLRKKLGKSAEKIETVTGIGYKWSEPEEE